MTTLYHLGFTSFWKLFICLFFVNLMHGHVMRSYLRVSNHIYQSNSNTCSFQTRIEIENSSRAWDGMCSFLVSNRSSYCQTWMSTMFLVSSIDYDLSTPIEFHSCKVTANAPLNLSLDSSLNYVPFLTISSSTYYQKGALTSKHLIYFTEVTQLVVMPCFCLTYVVYLSFVHLN